MTGAAKAFVQCSAVQVAGGWPAARLSHCGLDFGCDRDR